ncbi:TPA: hypothetical protein M2Q89_000698 [Escherichia coli]|nr:hypothetical protein [Escherichia coli]
MLTPEQKASLHRVEGVEGLLTALFEEAKEKLAFQIINTESKESTHREQLYKQVETLNTVLDVIKTNIRNHKNSL